MSATSNIESADDLYRVLREHWRGVFLYRGEDSADYQLRPKMGRLPDFSPGRRPYSEQAMLRDFKRRGAPYLTLLPANDWEWLAIAQHFGMSTRLLDWSENPLVAVWFATHAPYQGKNRTLYILDTANITDASEDTTPFDVTGVVLYRPKHVANRITSQRGVFTVHGNPDESFVGPGLERFVINVQCVSELYGTVENYGIDESFVFPDLGGLARHINRGWGAFLP